MTPLTELNEHKGTEAKARFNEMTQNPHSRQETKAFLLVKAQLFLSLNSAKHQVTGVPLVSRKERRAAAKQMAKRLLKKSLSHEVPVV